MTGVLAAALAPARGRGAPQSLREIGLNRGIDIGTAVGETASTRLLEIINSHCTLITPEWQLKPKFLRPHAASRYNFVPADEIARLAEVNGQRLHGHSLFWHRQPIAWAEEGDLDRTKRVYGGYIRDVVARYPGVVSWDVFNEIIDHERPLRHHALINRFGLDFIDFCFREAHAVAPGAKLVLNDHNLECAGDWCGIKQLNALRLLEELQRRGTPVHALGLQGHLSSTWPPWGRRTASFVRRVGELGLDVYISELDVDDGQMAQEEARRDLQVAAYYRDFLGPVLEQKALKRVVFWGISDSAHWMVRGAGGGIRRSQGRPRPALFDEDDEPKPAFEAVRRALAQAPAR